MNIDAQQYQKIVVAAYTEPSKAAEAAGGSAYRDAYAATTLPPGDAELIIAIAQLATAADRIDDPDERALFDTLAGHVYKHAKLETTAPTIAPVDDDEQRIEHLRSHAAQLAGKPSASLAFALAYALVIADLELAPEEGALLDTLREALGLEEERADDLTAAVGIAITPDE